MYMLCFSFYPNLEISIFYATMSPMNSDEYIPTIGLEIHAELKTDTKMFCHSKNNPDETKPNTNVCPVCMGHPGTLPTINKQAIEHMIRIGLALHGDIADFTEFDRKNYFYPDIPKGYQISQFKYPIVSGGKLRGIDVTRVHLEEDTGTSKHDRGEFSLVDFNRAGLPLMELVTEPVIHSAKEAGDFGRELQLVLRELGVAEANMEKGEMRVEANISVSKDSGTLGTKVEVKNLNSFKIVEKAIDFEITRMRRLLKEGRGDEIVQETRGWDETKEVTFSQRKKESSDDYRYFPEPDLPKMKLYEAFDLEALAKTIPELPEERRTRYAKDFNLKEDDIEMYIRNTQLRNYFEEVVQDVANVEKASNYITSDIAFLLQEEGTHLPTVDAFRSVIAMIEKGDVSSRGAKDLLALLVKADESADPKVLAEEHGFIQKSDTESLKKIAQKIIDDNPNVVEDFKKGKETALKFLMGQAMRETKGSANPQVLEPLFKELL